MPVIRLLQGKLNHAKIEGLNQEEISISLKMEFSSHDGVAASDILKAINYISDKVKNVEKYKEFNVALMNVNLFQFTAEDAGKISVKTEPLSGYKSKLLAYIKRTDGYKKEEAIYLEEQSRYGEV